MAIDLWTFRAAPFQKDLIGFDVEADDGHIGKVDEASTDAGNGYIVVDTGPWIFGRKVLLPAGTIESVDESSMTIRVDRTKDEIEHAPEFDDTGWPDPDTGWGDGDERRKRLNAYYGPLYAMP
jgi:hypothetical protein